MTATEVDHPSDDLLSVDELAAATGLTVRTTRYYAGRGLLPPPVRRGRMAFYGPEHRARLELVRALQDHGFTLAAIERHLRQIPLAAGVEELALQRAVLMSWTPGLGDSLTRAQLAKRAGRTLDDDDIDLLIVLQAVRRDGDRFEVLAPFETSIAVIDLELPRESLIAGARAIGRHMSALASDLSSVMHDLVLAPFTEEEQSPAEHSRMEQTISQLRQLTLEAVVTGYQRAANQVISRSLEGADQGPSGKTPQSP